MSRPIYNFDFSKAQSLIREKFMTYKAFAKEAGVSQNTISKICNRKSLPSEMTARRIAVALGLPYSDLLVIPRIQKIDPLVFSEDHAKDFIKGVVNLAKSRTFDVQIEYHLDQATPKMILDFVSYGINQFGLIPKELKIIERECDKND